MSFLTVCIALSAWTWAAIVRRSLRLGPGILASGDEARWPWPRLPYSRYWKPCRPPESTTEIRGRHACPMTGVAVVARGTLVNLVYLRSHPAARANAAASLVRSAPSLVRIERRWVFTVLSDTKRVAAICW